MTISSAGLQLFFAAIFVSLILLRVFRAVKNTQDAQRDNERIARLERKVEAISRHLNLADDAPNFANSVSTPSPWDAPQNASTRTGAVTSGGNYVDEVKTLLQNGQKIQAIKLLREQTNLGLKESKDAVEEIERQL